jgi:hypothetical protein
MAGSLRTMVAGRISGQQRLPLCINGSWSGVSKTGPADTTYFRLRTSRAAHRRDGRVPALSRQELVWFPTRPLRVLTRRKNGGAVLYPIYTDHLNTRGLIHRTWRSNGVGMAARTFGAGSANGTERAWGRSRSICVSDVLRCGDGTALQYFGTTHERGKVCSERSDWIAGGLNSYAYVESSPPPTPPPPPPPPHPDIRPGADH